MAKTESEVRSLFAEFCNKVVKTGELILANVVEVDSQERTCTIIDDDTEYYGVRLQPITEGQSGVVLTPKAGAFVLVSRIEGGDLYVIAASEYDCLSANHANTRQRRHRSQQRRQRRNGENRQDDRVDETSV